MLKGEVTVGYVTFVVIYCKYVRVQFPEHIIQNENEDVTFKKNLNKSLLQPLTKFP